MRVSILLNIADGLCNYFDNMDPGSRDRFLRAYSLAAAAGQYDLQSRAASWIALLAYAAYNFEEMTKFIAEGISLNSSSDSSTKSRLCMILALTAHLANRFDVASPWYERSRQYAADLEDEATLSALMHNMASIWAANRRNEVIGGIRTSDKSRIALLGAMSTLNFDERVGALSLNTLTPLIQAQLYSLEGNYAHALEIYSTNLDTLRLRSVSGWQSWLHADRAWCQLKMGYLNEGREQLTRAQESLRQDQHVDDRAATYQRLAECHSLLGDNDASTSYGAKARTCWRQFLELQATMLKHVSSVSGTVF